MDSNKSDDIDDVIRQEGSRGSSWLPSMDDVKAHRQWVRDCKAILRAMEWEEIVSRLGLRRGSAEYEGWRKIWTAYHGDSERALPKQQKPKP